MVVQNGVLCKICGKNINQFYFLSRLTEFEVKLSFVEDSLSRYRLHDGWMRLLVTFRTLFRQGCIFH